jgi:hypothetical protein
MKRSKGARTKLHQDDAESRVVVFVFGPPRSGTSAIAHVLERLGVSFGDHSRFIDPSIHTHNPIFFELRSLNELNDEIIRGEFGFDYTDFSRPAVPSDYDLEKIRRWHAEILGLLDEELGSVPVVGLKDPRFVYTLPYWIDAIESRRGRCRFVVTDRDMAASVLSNRVVNGFTDQHNRRIVKLSALMAAWQVRGRDAALVDYDALVECPDNSAAALADFLGLPKRNVVEAAAVLSRDLRHVDGKPSASSAVATDGEWIAMRASEYDGMLASLYEVGLSELFDDRVALRRAPPMLTGNETSGAAPVALEGAEAKSATRTPFDGMSVVNLPTMLLGDPDSVPRLYFAVGGNEYAEASALDGQTEFADGATVVRFGPLARHLFDRIRFDPDVVSGTYSVESVRIGGARLQCLHDHLRACSGRVLEPLSQGVLTFHAESDDPWIEFSALPEVTLPDVGVDIEVTFRRVSLLAIFRSSEYRIATRISESLQPRLGRIDDATSVLRSLEARAGKTHNVLVEFVGSWISGFPVALAQHEQKILEVQAGLSNKIESAVIAQEQRLLSSQSAGLASLTLSMASQGEAILASQADARATLEQAMVEQEQRLLGSQADSLAKVERAMAEQEQRVVCSQAELMASVDRSVTGALGKMHASLSQMSISASSVIESQISSLGIALRATQSDLHRVTEGKLASLDIRIDELMQEVADKGAEHAKTVAAVEEHLLKLAQDQREKLDSLESRVSLVLALAERRTVAYWWRRLIAAFRRH